MQCYLLQQNICHLSVRVGKHAGVSPFTAQKIKFSIKYFFSKCEQIRRKLRIWSHLLKKSLIGNFIFCAVINWEKAEVQKVYSSKRPYAFLWSYWRHGVVVIITAQLHSTKSEIRFCAGSNPARSKPEIGNGEDLWQWSWLEIKPNTFRRSTIPQKQFIIIFSIIIHWSL